MKRTPIGARQVPLTRTGKLKPRSTRRARQEREYRQIRLDFLATNPWCAATLPGCTGLATQVHHAAGRDGDRLTNVSRFVPICGPCHEYVTVNPLHAYALGLSERRNGVAS